MNKLINRIWRILRATFWYFVVIWTGIGYFWLMPGNDWYWFALMFPYAFVIWLIVSKLREITHF